MKWFKHDADAFLSEGVDALIDEEGFAGYGRWNRLLEIVAFKMDETNRCHVEYSPQKWCSLLKLKQKKLLSFLELTENQLKTKVKRTKNKIRIEIPNLLKKRDNYTKGLEVTSKKLSVRSRSRSRKEIDTDKDKNLILPDWLPKENWKGYLEMRKKIKKPMTERAVKLQINELTKLKKQGHDPGKVLDQSVRNSWQGLFPLKEGEKKEPVVKKNPRREKVEDFIREEMQKHNLTENHPKIRRLVQISQPYIQGKINGGQWENKIEEVRRG